MGTWGIDLWDQRETIEKHTHGGIEFLDKCTSFIKERIRIEQEYAKSLRRLVKQYQFKKKDEENLPFSYQLSFKSFLQENDDYAGQREVISEELYNNILKEMQKLSLESKTERKKTLQKLTECKNQIDRHQKALFAAKKKYDQASEDCDAALKGFEVAEESLESTKVQMSKYQKTSQDKSMLANKACEEYKSSLDNFNNKQTQYYETDLPEIITRELQEPEEKRINRLSFFLQTFSEIQKRVSPIISKCFDGMIEAAKVCEPEKDSLLLIDQHKSGEVPPGHVEFEEFGKPVGNNVSIRKKTSKSSLWKKKIVLSNANNANDYAYLPPAQRKKRFIKAINTLEEQLSQVEKVKAGILKIKETSQKFGGDMNDIQSQIDTYEKEAERIKPLLYQYQCYLATTIDSDATRKASRSTSVPPPLINSSQPVVISDVNLHEVPTTPTSDEFHDELRCIVLYDFSGSNDGEMTVYAAEELIIIDEGDGSGWTRVMRGTDEGYIPTSYVEWI